MQPKTCLSLCLILLLSLTETFGQSQIYIKNYYRPSITERKEIRSLYYPLVSPTLDLRDYRNNNSEYKNLIPEELNIILPDLENVKDVVWSVCYLEIPGEVEGVLLVNIIGNFFSEKPLYYLDFNLDKNFSNDGTNPFVFPNGIEVQSFTFTYTGRTYQPMTIELVNPKFQVMDISQQEQNPADTILPSIDFTSLKNRKNPKGIFLDKPTLYWDIKGRFGYGGIGYFFEAPDTRYFRAYSVEFNTKAIGIGLNLYNRRFRLGTSAYLENIFYWGSFGMKQVRGTPATCAPNWRGNLECSNLNGYLPEFTREIKPKNRYVLGVSAGYAIPLFRNSDLVAFAGANVLHYFNDIFIPNKAYKDINYKFGFNYAPEAGVSLEYKINNKGIFFISTSFQRMQFNPSGFFDNVEQLDVSHNQINIALGYRTAVRRN